jgi:hypothetical protein
MDSCLVLSFSGPHNHFRHFFQLICTLPFPYDIFIVVHFPHLHNDNFLRTFVAQSL